MNPRPEKNNMKFTNIKYQRRVVVETPEMNIPAGVVQYPKAEDVAPGDKVSYSLLMSFDGERSSRSSGTVLGHHPGSGLGHGAS
jgi:hypothetical protein